MRRTPLQQRFGLIAWLSDVADKEGERLLKKEKLATLCSNFNWNNVSKEGKIQYPNGKKPIAFIQRMIQLVSGEGKDDIILDFFAGSGSVAHAVYQQNLEDGGHRRCVSVQLPEKISEKDRKKYHSSEDLIHIENIADLAIERIKRAVVSIDKTMNEAMDGVCC